MHDQQNETENFPQIYIILTNLWGCIQLEVIRSRLPRERSFTGQNPVPILLRVFRVETRVGNLRKQMQKE